MASKTFDVNALIKVHSFDFNQNISANFKAWLCTIHPEYIRHSLANKIAPHDLNVLKEKYNYESRKRDPSAPWHNFVKRLPKLIEEAHLTTPDAQQPQEPQEPPTPPSLQERYDALLKKNADLVETNKALTTNAFKANKQLQDTTLKYNNLKRQWNSYTEHLQQEVESYKNDLNLKYDELRTNFKRTRQELVHTQSSLYHYAQKTRTLTTQIEDLKQEKQQILQSFNDFTPHDLSQEAFNALETKYQNPNTFIQEFSLTCPITQETFIEPVIALDGRTYEKSAIQRWFDDSHKSPETGEKLPSTLLIPNMFARILIEELHNH
tara:strand:+ start:3344 stop:4309 length:966 start_codon:yes stop_codon:yes gene_type:complete